MELVVHFWMETNSRNLETVWPDGKLVELGMRCIRRHSADIFRERMNVASLR